MKLVDIAKRIKILKILNRKYSIVVTSLFFILTGFQSLAQVPVNVNHTTGAPSVQLPMWTVTSKDISYPIILSYQSNGIKVGQGPSRVGMGWQISSGGMISRVVRGLPDDINMATKKGWLNGTSASDVQNFNPSADTNYSVATDENSDYQALDAFGGFDSSSVIEDTEPDIFYINVPGLSGKIIFDQNGDPKTIPYMDVTITVVEDATDSKIQSFSITTTSGVTYNFGLITTTEIVAVSHDESLLFFNKNDYYSYKTAVEFNSSWYLNTISSLDGGLISFEYNQPEIKTGESEYNTFSYSSDYSDSLFTSHYSPNADEFKEYSQYVKKYTQEQPYQLTKVKGNLYEVRFNSGLISIPLKFTPPVDWYWGPIDLRQPLVYSVAIYETSRSDLWLTKQYIFDYRYYNSDEPIMPVGEWPTYYPFLKSVRSSSLTSVQPPYLFDYYGFNDVDSTIFLSYRRSNSRDYFGYSNANLINNSQFELPELFVYPDLDEANRYRSTTPPNYGGKFYIFSGRSTTESVRGLEAGMLNSVTFPTGGKTALLYEPNTYFDSLANGNSYGGGLRVRQIRSHDAVDYTNDIVKRYEYVNSQGNSSGKLIKYPQHVFNLGIHFNPDDSTTTLQDDLGSFSDEQVWQRTLVRSKFNQGYDPLNGGASVAYTDIAVKQSGKGYIKYQYQFPLTYGMSQSGDWNVSSTKLARETVSGTYDGFGHLRFSYGYPFSSQSNFGYKQGLLIKQEVYNEGDTIQSSTTNSYIYSPVYSTLKALRKDMIGTSYSNGANTYGKEMYIYSPYTLRLGTNTLLQESVSIAYSPDGSGETSTTTTTNEYASSGAPYLVKTTTETEDNSKFRSYTKFSHDYDTVSNSSDDFVVALKRMAENGIKGIPIENISTIEEAGGSEKLASASIQTFQYVEGDKLRPSMTYAIRQSTPFTYTSTTFDSKVNTSTKEFDFDSRFEKISEVKSTDRYGNISSTESYNKQVGTVLYSYKGTVPVMNISGTVAASIAYSNFENIQDFDIVLEDHEFKFMPIKKTDPDPFVTGRVAGSCYIMTSALPLKLTKNIAKDVLNDQYIFSVWVIDSAQSAVLTLMGTDASNNTVTQTITLNNKTDWTYYETPMDVSSLDSNFTLTVSTNVKIYLDDVIFYPDHAVLGYTTYDRGFLKRAETDGSGNSVYYEYDKYDELILVKDPKKNIIKRITRNKTAPETVVNPQITFDDEVFIGVDHAFRVINTGIVSGATFYWDWKNIVTNPGTNPAEYNYSGISGIVSDNSTSFNFTSLPTNDIMVFVKISYSGNDYYANAIVAKEKFKKGSFAFDICVSGEMVVDLCSNGEENYLYTCSSITPVVGETKFYVDMTGNSSLYDEVRWYKSNSWYSQSNPGMYADDPSSDLLSNSTNATVSSYDDSDMYIICAVYKDSVRVGVSTDVKVIRTYLSNSTCATQ